MFSCFENLFPVSLLPASSAAAEDNYAGVKYPLSWAQEVKNRSTDAHKWMVLIDAAAYVPTQPLDLSAVEADFVDVAFYKMFGGLDHTLYK